MQNSNFAKGAQLPAAGWKTRVQMEADERRTLAPFAQKSGDSRGRHFPEQQHAYRTEFQDPFGIRTAAWRPARHCLPALTRFQVWVNPGVIWKAAISFSAATVET